MRKRDDGPDLSPLSDRADDLAEFDALVPGGRALAWAQEQAEAAFREWWEQELTIAEASAWSGFSEDHLRAMVGSKLPDMRKEARKGIPILVRRCDLPRKPLHARPGGPRGERS